MTCRSYEEKRKGERGRDCSGIQRVRSKWQCKR